MSNLPDLSALNSLSSEERALALEILKEYSQTGQSSTLEDLKYSDYEEIPVSITEFISNDRYLGRGLYITDEFTGERRCTVFPYWVKKLQEIFPDNLTTRYNTIILTGSIGLGKSFIAVICQLYLLYRMMCLKDPYVFYGLQKIDKITFSMLNVTIEAAQGVGWDKMQNLLQSSEWFMERGVLNASRTNPQWQPPKGIELIFGSSNRHVVGRALFSNFSDEVNFGIGSNVEKQKAKLKKMISQIDARMLSRFGKGTYLPTMNIIASSKDSEQAFMESYIEMKRQNESKTTLIVDEPQWVVRNDKGSPDDPGSFYVAVGNKFLAHELLPVDVTEAEVDAYREKGYYMLKVPPIYREAFEDNIDLALTDCAGISTSSSTKYISGIRLNQVKTDEYRNPFTKDIIEVGNADNDYAQYANFFDLSCVAPEDISRPLFIHLDMSLSGDKTGIAGTWITGKRPSMGAGEEARELDFKAAFSVSVKAPKGYQVSFEKTRNFIRWLRDQGFSIKCVSMDTYQSANMAQSLIADGFKVQILSVDRVDNVGIEQGRPIRVCKPYAFFKTAIYERHIKIYKKCDLLTEEITSLERLSDGHIDHPKNFCFTGDTKVALVDGRTLSFIDLVREYQEGKINYVYSMNLDTQQIEAKPIIKAWQTLKNQKLIKITLDNGEEIKCTYNHRFMLRNGEYIEAQNLVPNDSLMPLYTKVAKQGLKGCRLLYSPFENKWHYEHRQFAEEIFDAKYIVHHKDCNPLNNRPDNLVWMSKTAHMNEHYRQKMYEILNHKVVKVEYLDECEDVYDIEVADNHNFALAAGVFVHNSKDQTDALCGSLYTASQFAEEYGYSYGENLTASLEANLELDDQQLKTKMIQDFQDELLRTYQEVDLSPPFTPQPTTRTPRATIQSEQQTDYQTLMDISAGIIFI